MEFEQPELGHRLPLIAGDINGLTSGGVWNLRDLQNVWLNAESAAFHKKTGLEMIY